jgi:hypothetical protein
MDQTHIFNAENQCIGTGKNLGIVFRKARDYGGVKRIRVDQLNSHSMHYEALVNIWFANGYRACLNFSCYSHACEWAHERSAARPRTSWFHGCTVECNQCTR